MPGKSLSQKESSLIKDWERKKYSVPRLAGLEISGSGGLRGIYNLVFNCNQPITVICGPSGSGKSTLLDLCALAYRAPKTPLPDSILDDFNQHFVITENETLFTDFTVSWIYLDGDPPDNPPKVSFRGIDQTLSADRPERSITHITAARLGPIKYHSGAVAHFRSHPPLDETKTLPDTYLARLRDILNRPYNQATWNRSADFNLDTCETTIVYNNFNMSLAEESLIDIFRHIYKAPPQALILIEDIEVGLHPAAIARLAKNLVEMCMEKSLQIILSTRSFDFVDAMPRQFRTLIEFDGVTHQIENNVPMRRIMGSIGSSSPPDIVVFCEDTIAEALILQAVDGELRRRLKIIRVGSKTNLAQFAYSHFKSDWGHKVLIVWDGEVPDKEIKEWLRKLNMSEQEQQSLSRIKLPGPTPPERWLIDQLAQPGGTSLLADELNESERAVQVMLNILTTTSEHHSILHVLASKTRLDDKTVLRIVTKATSRLAHRPLLPLAQQIARVANGEIVIDVGILETGDH